MIHTASPLQADVSGNDPFNRRMSISSQRSLAVGGPGRCISVSLDYLGLMSPEQLKFGKQEPHALVWQLGVLLYRVAEKDAHPFLSCLSTAPSENFDLYEDSVRNAGFITQTRRNIIMIKYKKTKGLDLKSHKLQQLLDKVFISPPLSRLNLD